MYTTSRFMTYTPEVKKDLISVLVLLSFIIISLVGIKMYDTKTGEIKIIGEKILNKYVN